MCTVTGITGFKFKFVQITLCPYAAVSVFLSCVLIATAAPEGVHFSFGSKTRPCFVPSFDYNAVSSTVWMHNSAKKYYNKKNKHFFNEVTCFFEMFPAFVLIWPFLWGWFHYSCCSCTPAARVQRKWCAVAVVMDKFLSVFSVSSCYGSAAFPELESCLAASLE